MKNTVTEYFEVCSTLSLNSNENREVFRCKHKHRSYYLAKQCATTQQARFAAMGSDVVVYVYYCEHGFRYWEVSPTNPHVERMVRNWGAWTALTKEERRTFTKDIVWCAKKYSAMYVVPIVILSTRRS